MSQNKTIVLVSLISMLYFFGSMAQASSMRTCVESSMVDRGIGHFIISNNRWNPSTFVGKIHLEIVKECHQKVSSLNDNHNLNGVPQVVPAQFNKTETNLLENHSSTPVDI